MKVVIELAGPPVGKGRPRFFRKTGHAYTPEPTRTYETNLKYAAQVAMAGRPPMEGPLAVVVVATLPIAESWSKKRKAAARDGVERPTKTPDWENIAKMLDAFNEVVWRDDAQVVEGRITKLYGERPALHVTVEQIEQRVL